jgi:hypothetical protein
MIPIKKEPPEYFKETKVYEKCVFCKKSTDTWHERTNNPVCSNCNKEHKVSELTNHFKKHKSLTS